MRKGLSKYQQAQYNNIRWRYRELEYLKWLLITCPPALCVSEYTVGTAVILV